MWKAKKKIYKVYILVLIFIGGIIVPKANVFAEGIPYDKSISIQQILSDYQYFINGNATLLNHNVGGIVAGGDAAIEPSYLGNIVSVGNYNGTAISSFLAGMDSYSEYIAQPVYYQTTLVSDMGSSFVAYTNETPFIDLSSAFLTLESQSADIVSKAYAVTEENIIGDAINGYTLNLPLGEYQSIVISKSIYDQVNYIQLNGVSSVNDFSEQEYMISISGVTDILLSFEYTSFAESESTGVKGILFSDGQSFNNSNSLKNMTSGILEAGQLNTDGMKLIWNFPNATTVNSDYIAGHMVATKAEVTIADGTGNFEGGIIADSIINNSAEGHFYPYMKIGDLYAGTVVEAPAGDASDGEPSDTSSGESTEPSNEDPSDDSKDSSSDTSYVASGNSAQNSTDNISGNQEADREEGTSYFEDVKGAVYEGMPKTGEESKVMIAKIGFLLFATVAVIFFLIGYVSRRRKMNEKEKVEEVYERQEKPKVL
jgi:hypothetical protein